MNEITITLDSREEAVLLFGSRDQFLREIRTLLGVNQLLGRGDQVLIKGTDERITQPGKIAIIYSHSAEGNEYRAYIEYLQSLGYFTGAVEDVELDELQGVHGLRALRVTVDLSNPRIDRRITPGDLQPATPDASRN